MTAELRARVLAAAAADASPTRAAVKRRNLLISTIAVASGVGAFVIFALLTSGGQLVRLGGEVAPHRHLERSVWLVVTTAGGALGVAATALWFALCRGRSIEGPTGGDTLTATTFIHRLNTAGGRAPSDGCTQLSDVGAKAFVPYAADYFFYTGDGSDADDGN